MSHRHITILDVARAAEVSTATVSHAFNSTGRIKPETRRRVLAIARKLRYYPNSNARSLAAHSSRTLGVIVSDIQNPFFSVAIRSFEARAQRWRYDVIVSETNYQLPLMRRAVERMLEKKVRGVAILTSEMSPSWLNEIVRQNIPITCFDLDFTSKGATNIKVDYLIGMRQVIEHLYGLGHRRIAYVGGRHTFKNILSRHQSYVATMEARGLEPWPVINGNQSLDGGYAAGLSLLKSSPLPTAVVAMNDLTAVGLIKAFSENGLSIPADVSVTGFDNTYLAEYFVPRLTTLDMHPDILGETAAEALHEMSTLPEASGKEYHIKIELVVGKSTGPARGAL
ncbi:MAG TPA: LacI family DNA-binding transcriptional regulator [Terriglobia bacterium]|nr:LacI family DNA-binding transcriptional regulator [Terriglobia bacterium]